MPDAFQLASPGAYLIAPALWRIVPALAASLLLIAAVEARRDRPLRSSELFVRWRTWVLILPVWLAAVASPAAAVIIVVALSVQAVREFSRLVGLAPAPSRLLVAVAVTSAPLAVYDFTSWRALPPLMLLAATVVVMATCTVDRSVQQLGLTTIGLVYLPYLLTYVILLRAHERAGPGVLLMVGVAVALSDVGAYVAGSLFGRRPLAPSLSPNKTRAGAVGNLVGAGAAVAAFTFAAPHVPLWLVACIPVAVAAGAIWGDLLESLFKRHFEVKDAGTWLPGFGGLLDRIDSLLVVAPVTYTLIVVVGGLVARGGL